MTSGSRAVSPERRGSRQPVGGAPEPPSVGAAAVDREPDAYEVARTIALRSLEQAPRSRAQLGERLARRGVTPDVAERVLDRFTEVGLLDDGAYARMLVASKRASRGLAPRALALELRRAGIAADIAQTVLGELDAEDDEHVAAALVRRKARSVSALEPAVRERRLVAMLGRKGYSPGLALRVVRSVLHEDLAARDDGADTWVEE